MVAASYNLGMSGASKIIEKQKSPTYYDMIMSEEPSRYVFRVLALKNMLENQRDFGFVIDKDEKYILPKTQTIQITESIPDLHAYAESKNITYYQLRHLNPWIRDYALTVKNGKLFEIKLPAQ